MDTLKGHPLKRFFRLLRLDKKDIIFIYIYAIFEGIISLTIPVGIQAIINLIALNQVSSSWIVLTFIVALGTGVAGAMKLMQHIITETIQQRIFTRAAFDFAYRMPRLQMESIKNEYAPELANRFFDTLSIQKGIPKILVDLSAASLQIVFGLILLSLYHPFFVFFGFILLILIAIIVVSTFSPGLSSSLLESKYKYKVAYWLEELGRTMGSFKLAGRTKYPLEKTDDLVTGYLDYRKKHFRIVKVQMVSVIILKTLATAALLSIGGLLVINNELNIGQFVASEIVIIIILNALDKIVMGMETIFDLLTAVEKIGLVTDLPLEEETGLDFKEIYCPNGMSININNLTYETKEDKQKILDHISLEIKSGERVCVVGASASGKSTLLKVIMGLYNNFSGTISYNDIPRKNMNIASLRSYIGDHVTEEHLFHGTLIKNITMGRSNVTIQDVIEVCKKISLSEFIKSQPEGLNTMISSDGERLPQSVIKKIILARCIVDMPKLVVTEPLLYSMSSDDTKRIIEILTNKENPWTLIAVSRSAKMARACDRVVVMDQGQIIFNGSYQALEAQPYFDQLFDDVLN
ncbi:MULTISPECIES: peptidase domain-containing ABC transporter [unclassified Aureispira]|uniref:peptidase domain-containing ABC transporter n=1 Tax=unclassified Aureispira TaxID=2649989 RepID=UPI0006986B58|nr:MULTISPECIES: ATP-binding cassette domain-containing protein [unclassified Aureispira]WMX14522.1 ATP-binding cassette domain-containing protein [Aureispira sp. CCB-E]